MRFLAWKGKFVVIALFVGSLITGSLAGISSTSANPVYVIVTISPGTEDGDEGEMTCTWHGVFSGCPNGDDEALDWDQYGGDPGQEIAGDLVYFKAWTLYPIGIAVAEAVKNLDNGNCRRARFDILDLEGVERAEEYFTHTLMTGTDGSEHAIYGAPSYGYTEVEVGTTVNPYDEEYEDETDLDSCTTTGSHLHQGSPDMAAYNYMHYDATGSYEDLDDPANTYEMVFWEPEP
jgi:hypothetical protein